MCVNFCKFSLQISHVLDFKKKLCSVIKTFNIEFPIMTLHTKSKIIHLEISSVQKKNVNFELAYFLQNLFIVHAIITYNMGRVHFVDNLFRRHHLVDN